MKRLALLACLVLIAPGLAACPGTPPPEPRIVTQTVYVPTVQACVPKNMPAEAHDHPWSVEEMKAALAAAPDVTEDYRLMGGWILGFLARRAVSEPVVSGCAKVQPAATPAP